MIFIVKEKNRNVPLLPTMLILEFILSDAYFCLSYKKINYCKIQNSIIKTVII